HGLNFATDDGDFLILPELVEVTYLGLGEHFFATDTPGDANTEEFWLFVENVDFSHDRGFYDDSFDLTLSTDTAGAEIRYTTDGSEPTETNGTLYVAPAQIPIITTTAVRATAFKSGYASAGSVTHTYIFLEDVLQQPAVPDGFPADWKGVAPNYNMNQSVVNSTPTIRDDMKAVPVVSIVTSVEDMFGVTGIYSNPGGRGQAWERPASVEWFNTDGSTLFQVNAGVRIVGGASRGTGTKKHSFRLTFKGMYGPTTLDYPIFDDTDIDSFNTVTFRAGFNDTFWGGTMLQDRWAAERQIAAGGLGPHGRFVHLYIDGLYWGLYNPLERTDDAFAASYLGGEKEDYDYYTNQGIAGGNSTAWNLLHSLANDAVGNYAAIEEMLDIPEFCDYLMINQFAHNGDWPHNNWRATYNREGGGKWRFHMWDAEFGLRNLNGNHVNSFGGPPGSLFQKMLASPKFVSTFQDRAHRLLFNGGALTPQVNIDWVTEAAAKIHDAVMGESARWSGSRSNWESRINNLRNTYFPQRTGIFINQLKAVGRYPNVDAPSFNINSSYQHGGIIELGDSLTINASADTIYYTLDGGDPRDVDGGISPGALVYSGAMTLNESAFVKSRAYDSGTGEWSALNEAVYHVDLAPDIRITEVMYNPSDPTAAEIAAGYTNNDDFEYIEIKNISASETLPLAGLRFNNGIDFTFGDVSIAPGQFVVVVSNQAAFEYRYGSFSGVIGGEYGSGIVDGTSLNNAGEKIELDSPNGGIIHDFKYGDGWYGHTDGDGFSLTIRDPQGSGELWDQKIGWRPSAALGGSPGYEDVLTDPGAIIVTEVLAHSDAPFVDTIELYNTSMASVDISGWFLSDSKADLISYQIPAMPAILPGQYVVLYADTHFGGSFLLSEHGDDVYLSSNFGGQAGGYREHVDFGASPNNISFGLHTKSTGGTDFTLLSAHTFGGANASPYFEHLVINEMLYHPLDPTEAEETAGYADSSYFEFIEIYNSSATETYDLTDFYLSSGVGFTFGWYDADDSGEESWTLEPGATATWDAVLPAGLGSYEVFARWDLLDGLGSERNLDGQAVYSITHNGGTTAVVRDQKPELDDEGPDYIDEFGWVSLGTYDFDSAGQVVLTRGTGDPDNWTIADNIKFVRPGFSDVVVDNPTLDSWYTTNGSSTIGPGQYVVVVSDYAAFDDRYDISSNSIPVAGEYTGTLSNAGDKVKLMRVGAADPLTDFIPYYRIDYVNYDDVLPWPEEADGAGYSMMRLRGGPGELYGNDPASWAASAYRGTPGLLNAPIDPTPPVVPTGLGGTVVLAGGTQIELTWASSSDPDSGVDHYLIYRDGVIIGTSSGTTYNDTLVSPVTQYSYQVAAVNRDQFASAPSAAVDIVIPGPMFVEITNQTTLRLVFTESLVEASAEDTGNYTFSGGAISQATLIGGDTVELTVPALAIGQTYTVTVDGIDTVSGLLMPDAQQLDLEYYLPGGGILREYWVGVSGSAVSNLTSNAGYPDNPTRRNYPTGFEAPLNLDDNYGTRMRGYVHPTVSGMYTFSIASNDSSELYLSTNTDPANMTRIANVSGSTGWRSWTA
ncbi:MAG: lamin tail domain-containing protein, partial [Phycisphaerae bacterium]|nr:lamin tail domain-containing protein [Phycisphaerae bacterium]